jgi:RNA recognition motif-containing protein
MSVLKGTNKVCWPAEGREILFVGNLATTATEQDVWKLFSKYSSVNYTWVRLALDETPNHDKGGNLRRTKTFIFFTKSLHFSKPCGYPSELPKYVKYQSFEGENFANISKNVGVK